MVAELAKFGDPAAALPLHSRGKRLARKVGPELARLYGGHPLVR